MNRDLVLALSRVEADPAVSVLVPLHRSATRHDADRRRAAALIDEAAQIVRRSYPDREASEIQRRLEAVARDLDLSHAREGLAVFVAAGEQHVIDVPFAVTEQVAIEEVFATRQLLVGLAHAPTALVLVFDQHLARLFEDQQGELVELHGEGFPLAHPPEPRPRPGHRDRPSHEHAEAEHQRRALRAVDDALDHVLTDGTTPLIVVGPPPQLALFDEVSHHGPLVGGRVRGDHVHSPIPDIERAVRPAIDAYVAERQAQAVRSVAQGVGTPSVLTDFASIWTAATEGRGLRLVMEEDFRFPLHLPDGLTPGDGPDEPWTLDDAADELIERVIRADGDVVFVPPDALAAVGPAALIVRYAT